MKKKIVFIILIIFYSINFSYLKAIENKILFKVDNQIITSVDIFNEAQYLKIMNNDINNLGEEKIFEIAKNSLIRDKIKEIEVLKKYQNFNLENDFFDQALLNYHSKLGLKNIEDIKKFLLSNNLDINRIKYKIAIQSYWNNLIYSLYSDKVKINRNEIKNNFIENSNTKIKSYLLSEIVFNVENKENHKITIDKIYDTIKSDGFENAALIYSIAESSNRNGLIGWVSENSLNESIKKNIIKLNINEYTLPIKIPSGYLILKLNNIKEDEIKINIDKEVEKIVFEKTNEQLNNYSNIYFNKLKKNTEIEKI